MNGLLKINVPQFIFLALSYIFAKNICSFIYFSSIFLKIVLKINVRLSLFRCHVCTVVVYCLEYESDHFKLKHNTYLNTNVNEFTTTYYLMQCVFLCLESRLCQCINYKKLDGTCQMMFFNPKTDVFPSHMINATDWTLGCRKSGEQIYMPDIYCDLSNN